MKSNIGFTGIGGWIGSCVSDYFLNNDYNVIDLGPWSRISKNLGKFDDLPSIDWAFHFGASTSIKDSYDEPFSFYQNNINSTIRLLKIVKKSQAKIIFMSSYIYGSPKYLPVDENHPISITNPYMGSKYLSEQVCVEICNQLSIEFVVFRLFNIYSPGFCKGRLVSDLLENALKGIPIELNDPLPERDYLYVKDLAFLLEKFTKVGILKSGEIYNIGYGKSYSNDDVTKIVEKVVGKKLLIKVSNEKRPNDIISIHMSPQKIMNDYQWYPTFDLESGISDLITSNQKR
jgi:UDP-glucose 4-epimerase